MCREKARYHWIGDSKCPRMDVDVVAKIVISATAGNLNPLRPTSGQARRTYIPVCGESYLRYAYRLLSISRTISMTLKDLLKKRFVT
jgi:hypothetical protein